MRRSKPEQRKTTGDIRYNNPAIRGLINRMMKRGKKSTATRIVYDAFAMIEQRVKRNPVEVFEEAIKNTSPVLEVKPRRVGGATYQVPVEVMPDPRTSLGVRWILTAARGPPGNPR